MTKGQCAVLSELPAQLPAKRRQGPDSLPSDRLQIEGDKHRDLSVAQGIGCYYYKIACCAGSSRRVATQGAVVFSTGNNASWVCRG